VLPHGFIDQLFGSTKAFQNQVYFRRETNQVGVAGVLFQSSLALLQSSNGFPVIEVTERLIILAPLRRFS